MSCGKKLSLLLSPFEVLQHLNTFTYTNFRRVRKGCSFCDRGRVNDAAFSWRPEKLLHVFWVRKRYRYFEILLSKYSLSQNKYNLNLSYVFLKRWIHAFEGKLNDRCFCWFPAAIFVPLKLKWHQHGVSLQSSINVGITLFRISRIWNITKTRFLTRRFVYL